jgi:hypothetical protein
LEETTSWLVHTEIKIITIKPKRSFPNFSINVMFTLWVWDSEMNCRHTNLNLATLLILSPYFPHPSIHDLTHETFIILQVLQSNDFDFSKIKPLHTTIPLFYTVLALNSFNSKLRSRRLPELHK